MTITYRTQLQIMDGRLKQNRVISTTSNLNFIILSPAYERPNNFSTCADSSTNTTQFFQSNNVCYAFVFLEEEEEERVREGEEEDQHHHHAKIPKGMQAMQQTG